MCTPRSRYNRFYICFLATMGFTGIAIAAEQTYVREYTYQASEADSKISARTIALQEVKRELLGELGTHVTALVKIESSSDGTTLGKEEIETLSAGVTRVEILDEKWNGVVYVLKAQIKADPEDVLKNLHKMLDADKNQKQITQLSNDLSKVKTEKIQIAESFTQSKKETTAALAEIDRLKKQLEGKQTEDSQKLLQKSYQLQVEQLSLNELFESAMQLYNKGDSIEAFNLLRKAADRGHAIAQFNIGVMYDHGEGVVRDAKQAVYWFRKAADQGETDAQYYLGVMYAFGKGVPKNNAKAFAWYEKAAIGGNTDAQTELGKMYENGLGVKKSSVKAREWFEKSAQRGNRSYDMLRLGEYYEDHFDHAKAFEWYEKAALQGNPSAQHKLGEIYLEGKGVVKSEVKAFEWFEKSAQWGSPFSQQVIGMMYLEGRGVQADKVMAYAWLNIAAKESFMEDAKKARDLISLYGLQLVEAERISSEWKRGLKLRRLSK